MNRVDIRRRMLESLSNKVIFSYTGSYDFSGDEYKGYLILKTSGTLTIKGVVDLCLVGGGGRGYKGWHTPGGTTTSYWRGGGGGAGGFVSNYTEQDLNDDFTVTIGAGSSTEGSAGGQTSVGASFTANGGNSPSAYQVAAVGRGTSGSGSASSSVNGGNGEDGVYPFNDATNFASYRVSGCGGGGVGGIAGVTSGEGGSGGSGGGGNGGTRDVGNSGTANTGGGGGGGGVAGSSSSPSWKNGGNGGSGVVFICWGYTHE